MKTMLRCGGGGVNGRRHMRRLGSALTPDRSRPSRICGAIGPGRMTEAGPSMFTPLLVAVPVMAMGGALGEFLPSAGGAGEQQIGEIRAGDQQHQSNRA